MEELTKMRERLKNNRLSYTWLIYQLHYRGIETDRSEMSSVFVGTRKGPKVEMIVKATEKILDDYENGKVFVPG